jgi:hypothetical protein
MCSRCNSKITTFYTKHTEEQCPLYKAYYCSYCAKYGHLRSSCTRKRTILSKKLVPKLVEEKKVEIPKTIEIKDSDAVISAYLTSRGIDSVKRASENREILEEYAEENDYILVREWQAKIIIPMSSAKISEGETEHITASIKSTMSLKDIYNSLVDRGYEFPKKIGFQVNGRSINSLDKVTSKDTIQIISKV